MGLLSIVSSYERGSQLLIKPSSSLIDLSKDPIYSLFSRPCKGFDHGSYLERRLKHLASVTWGLGVACS